MPQPRLAERAQRCSRHSSTGVVRCYRPRVDIFDDLTVVQKSFIAPDMAMRPVGETVTLLERAGQEVRDVHAPREHYVWTIDAWIERLESRWGVLVALVGEEVARVWRLCLVGARLSLRRGRMDVDQILAVRPGELAGSGMDAVRTAITRVRMPVTPERHSHAAPRAGAAQRPPRTARRGRVNPCELRNRGVQEA